MGRCSGHGSAAAVHFIFWTESRVARLFERGGGADPAERIVPVRRRDDLLLHLAIQVLADRKHGLVKHLLGHVGQANLLTSLRTNVGDSIAHRTPADHRDFLYRHA